MMIPLYARNPYFVSFELYEYAVLDDIIALHSDENLRHASLKTFSCLEYDLVRFEICPCANGHKCVAWQ